jgi:ribosome-associated heat shock protein Hsp15
MEEKIRIDRWLHSVRVYKTRSQAADACTGGKVKIKGQNVKPARTLSAGELVVCRKGLLEITLKVIKLIGKRVGAQEAVLCYEDLTPPEEKNKFMMSSAFVNMSVRDRGTGRPTKKERREIDRLYEDWEDE